MPRYLVQRNFGPADEAAMREVGTDSNRIIAEQCPGVTWEVSHVVADADGNIRTFCIYDAPDEDSLRKHASLLGRHEVDVMYEIAGDIHPADFPS
jgi:hypothetical protein